MSQNRTELLRRVAPIPGQLLLENGYIAFVDVFLRLGALSQADYERWRRRDVPYLEQVIHLNLAKISVLMRHVQRTCLQGHFRPRHVVYMSWGKRPRVGLRFTKTGDASLEA